MTPEERQLLLKVLCAMLPYRVKCKFGDTIKTLDGVYHDGSLWLKDQPSGLHYDCTIDDVKLYLRPMSSMTDEERNEATQFEINNLGPVGFNWDLLVLNSSKLEDWLNAHYFDYHGLVPIGLALEALEGMYRTE